ncbi:MAG: DUF1285 domain-containing protein [Paracoccaceae bacterium]|nr:DUF1285 domain-containing protein [Paracoccaceae bacterium]
MNNKKANTPSAEGIAAAARAAIKSNTLPPVMSWNPPFCGDLDIRIARNGTWYYLGTPIGRFELVKLFSSILKIEDGKYFLVTPIEKVGIKVDDAPFVAVDFNEIEVIGEKALKFETQVGDEVIASDKNPIRVVRDAVSDEPAPYIHIRNGLDALIDRKTFYRLIDIGQHKKYKNEDWFGIESASAFFPIIKSEELNNSI